jgi:mono/diheme cytochrome c family protein
MKKLSRLCAVLVLGLLLGYAVYPAQGLSTHESEQAGAILFRDKGCTYCHGPAGMGTEKGPSLETVGKRLTADQMRNQITHGGQKMPPFAEALTADQIGQLVSFLRAKHRAFAPPVPVSPPLSNPAQ